MESVFPTGNSGRRRTPFSSFSSCSSSLLDELSSPLSPATPLRPIISGVPFSWEKLPGIPKKQTPEKPNDYSSSSLLLPLPPSKHRNDGIKKMAKNRQEDPFLAALVECSKQKQDQDPDQESNNVWSDNVSRTYLSYVFGFSNLYTSCKNTCAVSESIVYLPRSARSASYNLPKSARSASYDLPKS